MKEKWLFLRYRAIGDVIMAAWPITSIRLAKPDAEFWLASEQGFESAIDDQRLVQRYYLLPRKKWKNARWNLITWREQIKFYTGLREVGFDYGVDFQGHTKTALLLRLSGAKNRVQCNATDALSKRLNPVVTTTAVHKVDQMFETLVRFGVFEKPKLPIMPIMTACPIDLGGRKLITINTGSSSPDKNYSLEGWREIASNLTRAGFVVAGVGGPADPPLELAGVHDFAGKLSFRESLSLIAHGAVHLSGDTSTAHGAAAYGCAYVTLFLSSHNPPERFRPYSDRGTILQNAPSPTEIFDATLNWAETEF